MMPSVAWAELGGVDFFYSLQRECARRRLASQREAAQGLVQSDPTALLQLRLERLVEGPGLVRVDATNQDQALTLWLFPQQLPAYLEYKTILAFICGSANRYLLHCRESSEKPGHWFVERLEK